jgi:hypothetical protein
LRRGERCGRSREKEGKEREKKLDGWGCLGTRESYARQMGEMRAEPVRSDWRMNIVTLMIRGEMDID